MKFVGLNIQSKSQDQFWLLCPKRNADLETLLKTATIASFPCSEALAFTAFLRLSVIVVTFGSFPSNILLNVAIRAL